MHQPEIKTFYEHEHAYSIFVMFRTSMELVWSFSGNELRRVYLEHPDNFMSGPIELQLPEDLYEQLSRKVEDDPDGG